MGGADSCWNSLVRFSPRWIQRPGGSTHPEEAAESPDFSFGQVHLAWALTEEGGAALNEYGAHHPMGWGLWLHKRGRGKASDSPCLLTAAQSGQCLKDTAGATSLPWEIASEPIQNLPFLKLPFVGWFRQIVYHRDIVTNIVTDIVTKTERHWCLELLA